MRRRNIARDLTALVLAIVGGVTLIALGTLLASRHEWLAVGLLVGGVVATVAGVRLGRYDPDARGGRMPPRASADAIEMVPVVRPPLNDPGTPPTP